MDGASELQLRELRRVAKFVLDTKDLGLHIVPTMNNGIWMRREKVNLNMNWEGLWVSMQCPCLWAMSA